MLTAMEPSVRRWAEWYQKMGLKPLPITQGAKFPGVPWEPYQSHAPTPEDIDRWFSNDVDGVVNVLDGTGFVVIDGDGDPEAVDRVLADAGINIPDACPRVITGSGTVHLYFRSDQQLGRHIRLLEDGDVAIDVLGQGCVVAPPSLHPDTGQPYHWAPPFVKLELVPTLPARVLELIADAERSTQQQLGPVTDAIPERQREATLTSSLGATRRRGASEAELLALATAVNERCVPPLHTRDLHRVVGSIARYAPNRIDGVYADVLADVAANRTAKRTISVVPASRITPEHVRWWWKDRAAVGTVSLVGGREGVGKSMLTLTVAADTTRGRLPGDCEGTPRSVIIAATEDSWAHTIVPRLLAADADLERVFRVDVKTTDGLDTVLSLPRDLEALEGVTREAEASLIILDPLVSRLDANLDTHKDAEVRKALEPLARLGEAAGACILGLIHVNKSTTTDPLTMLMGSRAFAAVARSVLFVMTDPDDETRRLVGQPKNNLGRSDLPTLSFYIDGASVAGVDTDPILTSRLVWGEESDRSIQEAVTVSRSSVFQRTVADEAAGWLKAHLSSVGGHQEAMVILKEGREAGHSKNALYRARYELNLATESGGFPRKCVWELPGFLPVVPTSLGESHTGNTRNTGMTAHDTKGPQVSQFAQVYSFPHESRNTGPHTAEPLIKETLMATDRSPPDTTLATNKEAGAGTPAPQDHRLTTTEDTKNEQE